MRKRPAWDPISDPALSADLREYWTERAAIGEYLGDLSRAAAERQADKLAEARAALLRSR